MVRSVGGPLGRLFHAGRLRPGRRDADEFHSPEGRREKACHKHHRSLLGRQRGMADNGRRRDLRGFPHDIRLHVQLSVPRPPDNIIRADIQGRRFRVQGQGRRR